MATILATTTLDLTRAQKRELFDEIISALAKTFPKHSLMFRQLDEDDFIGKVEKQIQFVICVPPYMDIDRRRTLVKNLNETMENFKANESDIKVITTFVYHDDESCGVDGVLRSDAKVSK